MFIASTLNAKLHLLSGIVIGAGALLLVKQMRNRKTQHQHHKSVMTQPTAATETASE